MKIKVTDIIHDNDGTVKIFYDMIVVEEAFALTHLIHGSVTIPESSFAKLKNKTEKPEDFIILLLYTEGVNLIESIPDYLDCDTLLDIMEEVK
jgi:hypothetical protein